MAVVVTPKLIEMLAADAAPVRRLQPPTLRAALWIGVGVLVLGVVGAINGVRPDLADKAEQMPFLFQLGASFVTGVTAVIAAYHLSLPDRSRWWSLLPLPSFVIWMLGLGWGCLINWVDLTPEALTLDPILRCVRTVVMTSAPLLGLLLVMLRHAGPIRPRLTAAMGALGVAAIASGGVMLFHDLEATVMVLAFNLGTMALLMAVLGLAGAKAFPGHARLVVPSRQ